MEAILLEVEFIKYFLDSNLAEQVIVVLLMIFSVIGWAVMFNKYFDLKELKNLNIITERKLAREKSIINAVANDRSMKGPYATLVYEAVAAWGRCNIEHDSPEMLTLKMNHVQNALQRSVTILSEKYESKMVILGTVVSGAPFMGLLGTVWGIMHSFGALGDQPSVTLQILAPGVSGALLATISGLIVAIPSLFGYNYLLGISSKMLNELENFASLLADTIELESRVRHAEKVESQQTVAPSVQTPLPRSYSEQPQQYSQAQQHYQPAQPRPQFEREQTPPPSTQERRTKFNFDDDDDDSVAPSRRYDD